MYEEKRINKIKRNDFKNIIKSRCVWNLDNEIGTERKELSKKRLLEIEDSLFSLTIEQMELDDLSIAEDGNFYKATAPMVNPKTGYFNDFPIYITTKLKNEFGDYKYDEEETVIEKCSFLKQTERVKKFVEEIMSGNNS